MSYALEQRGRAIRQKTSWKSRLDESRSNGGPRIFVEPIAAGEKVVADKRGPTAEFLRAQYSDAVAVEMEGRGFLEGVRINSQVQGCVIRGISDLLDRKAAADAGGSQELAADAASAVAFEMLSTLPGSKAGSDRSGLKTAPMQVQRVPLTRLREWASEAGWCTDVQAATVGDNDWWTFTVWLRQAAVDGEITFWGRRYVSDYGKDLDSEPLTKIPRKHFEEFGFDPTRIAQVDNYDIFTEKTGGPLSAWKGSIFRDLHVDPEQARAWLKAAGAPPPSANIAVSLDTSEARIGDYQPVCSLIVENVGLTDLRECLAEMVDVSRKPADMPTPFVLRTDNQIRSGERGPFTLARRQRRILPVVFCLAQGPRRPNDWYLFDEHGKKYFISADPTKMILRIYGGPAPGNALVFIDVDAGWRVFATVKTVPSGHTLRDEP